MPRPQADACMAASRYPACGLFFAYFMAPMPQCGKFDPLRVINIKDAAMNISGINSSNSFAFPSIEKEESASPTALSHDVVSLSSPNLLADDEVDGVLADTMGMISQNPMSALSVHGGLSASRVASLLSM